MTHNTTGTNKGQRGWLCCGRFGFLQALRHYNGRAYHRPATALQTRRARNK